MDAPCAGRFTDSIGCGRCHRLTRVFDRVPIEVDMTAYPITVSGGTNLRALFDGQLSPTC